MTFNPQQMSENLRDYGSFVPGIRPGAAHGRVSREGHDADNHGGRRSSWRSSRSCRIVLGNATGFDRYVTGFFGGTGLLIVVGVALDLVERIETHLLMRHYEGFMRKGRIRGRRG